MAFRVGDSVKMKDGVKDSEYEKWDLSGWQGWVIARPQRGKTETYQSKKPKKWRKNGEENIHKKK